jgi:ribose 5-phosphate isomerase RpiB
MVDIFLSTPFEGGRHARRLGKIVQIERGEAPTGPHNGNG